MANYPPYQYQPQQMGYVPNVYPQYQQPPQYQTQQQQPQQEQFFCRPVASEEEARGFPVDFSGNPMFFSHLSAGHVYMKAFDKGSGNAVFCKFRRYEDQPQEPVQSAVAFAPMSELEGLRAMVVELQNELRAMKNSKRKNAQEVADNE